MCGLAQGDGLGCTERRKEPRWKRTMARCGRCWLWHRHKTDNAPHQIAGTCLWYQIQLTGEEEYESRECPDFAERPGDIDAPTAFGIKSKKEELRDAYEEARSAKKVAIQGAGVALVSILWDFLELLLASLF
jgi:hypothetical protein